MCIFLVWFTELSSDQEKLNVYFSVLLYNDKFQVLMYWKKQNGYKFKEYNNI